MATTVEQLIIFHEIAQVKYRYLRALDTHDWALMRSCFTPNARETPRMMLTEWVYGAD